VLFNPGIIGRQTLCGPNAEALGVRTVDTYDKRPDLKT
jgi:hypothetical protein